MKLDHHAPKPGEIWEHSLGEQWQIVRLMGSNAFGLQVRARLLNGLRAGQLRCINVGETTQINRWKRIHANSSS